MFTGIIESLGTIRTLRSGQGVRMSIQADFDLAGVKLGDSIAVSGACLTVVSLDGDLFSVDVSPETCARSTLGKARPGDIVNLERALTLSARLDGHLVTGHIDGMAKVQSVTRDENAILYTFDIPAEQARYMVEKGSVAVDGISLTINTCTSSSFSVSIIPHTAKLTTIGHRKPGDSVNIETDIIGKYVERFVSAATEGADKNTKRSGVSMELLARTGFL